MAMASVQFWRRTPFEAGTNIGWSTNVAGTADGLVTTPVVAFPVVHVETVLLYEEGSATIRKSDVIPHTFPSGDDLAIGCPVSDHNRTPRQLGDNRADCLGTFTSVG